ncbi:MAG TPA: redoxin domain-containing protein [Deferrisomatales bacterium]|nr:redoxin domain-containing protein [Deferrisomatales bacterium]
MVRTWLIAATAIAATGITQPDPAQAFKRLEVGQLVADHTLMTPGGEARQLASALGSRATAIAFWAHWSPRSREALQGVQDLLVAHRNDGLAVVAVNVDGERPTTEVHVLLAEAALELTQLVDADLSLYDAYGVVAVPSLVLLDSSRRVATLMSGYSSGALETFAEQTRRVLGLAEPGRSPTGLATGYQPRGAAQGHFRMAQLYLRKHRLEQAVELLAKAVAEDPLFTEARDTLADALRQAGRSDEAARLELALVESEEYCLVPRRGHAPAQWQ